MNARRRLKLSALSFSLPDVSEVGYTPSPSYHPPAQEILEEPEEADEREVEPESGRGSYGAADSTREREEGWMSAIDPISGSVFFVDSASLPRPHPNGSAIIPSTSSSSLSSSTTSLSHPPLPSLTSSPRPQRSSSFSTSLPPTPNDAFFSPGHTAGPPSLPPLSHHQSVTPCHSVTSSALPSPTNSQNFDEFFASESYVCEALEEGSTHCPSPCPSEGWMPKSLSTSSVGGGRGSMRWRMRRRFKKMVGRGDKSRGRSHSHGLMPSDSVPNLCTEAEYPRLPPSSVPPSPPHGEIFGSQTFPLEAVQGSILTARVSLKPHPLAGRLHRHWNLEKLGIIPARSLGGKRYRSFTNLKFAFKNHYPSGSAHSSSSSSLSNSLVIRGIIPGTPASLVPQLQQGDTVLAINGHGVFLENANSIVRSQSEEEELVLIVKKRTHVGSTLTSTPAHHHLLTSSRHGNLVRLVSGKQPVSSSRRHHSPPLLFLHLTLDTKEEDPADKDILYCYPTGARDWVAGEGGEGEGREEVTGLLMKLRGVFLTLSDVMGSITTDSHSCSTVEVRGQMFHCAHVQRGKEVVLLALPASLLPRPLLLASTIRLEDTLHLLHGSLHCVSEDQSGVDHVMSLLFHHLSSHSPISPWPHPLSISPLTSVTAVHREPYPTETILRVSEALDELETVTISYHISDFAHSPPTFIPRGSALFHKGQLVVSHLSPGELVGVVAFCQSYHLLEISANEPNPSIVIWREVHLQQSPSSEVEEAEMRGRVFLLLVGLDRVLVGLVMEGCGLSDEATPTVDPAYVSEAKRLIANLDIQDIFDSNTSGRSSMKQQVPVVASLDRVLTAHLSTPRHTTLSSRSSSSRKLSLDKHQSNKKAAGSDSEDEDGSVPGLGPRSMTLPSLRPRGKKRSEDLPLLPETLSLRQNFTLTAGNDNILLHYLSLEAGQGVWLGPAHHTSSTYGTLHSEMITCFHTTCSAIREILLTKTDDDLEDDDEWEDSDEEEAVIGRETSPSPPSSYPPLSGGRCVEHGVLLEVPLRHFVSEKQLRNTPPLCYWVVGRMFEESRHELYVCYEENISQTMVEMAFKLLFGSATI